MLSSLLREQPNGPSRYVRLRRRHDALCSAEGNTESAEHLFTACTRTQGAWAWARRKIIHLNIEHLSIRL